MSQPHPENNLDSEQAAKPQAINETVVGKEQHTPLPSMLRGILRNWGGHGQFNTYRKWFKELYCDPQKPIIDVLGRRVLFDTEPLKSAAHVCYGGEKGRAHNAACWYQERAERIGWIRTALEQPKNIHPDEESSMYQKYMLYVPPETAEQEGEFYMVIVRLLSQPKTVAFITAYSISQIQHDKFSGIAPRVYPVAPKKKKRKPPE